MLNVKACRAALPVLEEEGLSSDLGHGVEHHRLRADVHGGHRTLGGGQGLAPSPDSWGGERYAADV